MGSTHFFYYIRRCTIPRKQDNPINEKIGFRTLRVLDEEGNMIGVISKEEALEMARDRDLDLVLVSNNRDNPVAKLMNYGKYTFEQSKREREARKKQKITNLKEVQLRLSTEKHDFDVKVANAKRFLNNEDRVKVVIRFKGRERAFADKGIEVMEEFAAQCADVGAPERMPSMDGSSFMVMFLSPIKNKK